MRDALDDIWENLWGISLLLIAMMVAVAYVLIVEKPVGRKNHDPVFYETSTPTKDLGPTNKTILN